jgi:outer membrane receptor protein involved in Fe transport
MAIALALSNGNVQAQENSKVENKKVETERQIETIVVTSTRRAENQQTVPLAVQAMSGAKLQELGIDSFEDYIALLPGVSSEGQGPGKQETYIRGVSAGHSDVTDDVTVTLGARHYEIEMGLMGQSPFGQRASGPEADAGTNVDSRLAGLTPATISGTIYKANIRWKMNADAMFYGTYSEGFRGGGFNRSAGTGGIPATFDTDTVVSVEFGWKTAWLDNTLRFNSLVDADRVELPSYTQVNLSASIGKDDWKATLFVDNATDSLGQVAAGSADNVFRVSPTRPRTIGFRISYDY